MHFQVVLISMIGWVFLSVVQQIVGYLLLVYTQHKINVSLQLRYLFLLRRVHLVIRVQRQRFVQIDAVLFNVLVQLNVLQL